MYNSLEGKGALEEANAAAAQANGKQEITGRIVSKDILEKVLTSNWCTTRKKAENRFSKGR